MKPSPDSSKAILCISTPLRAKPTSAFLGIVQAPLPVQAAAWTTVFLGPRLLRCNLMFSRLLERQRGGGRHGALQLSRPTPPG